MSLVGEASESIKVISSLQSYTDVRFLQARCLILTRYIASWKYRTISFYLICKAVCPMDSTRTQYRTATVLFVSLNICPGEKHNVEDIRQLYSEVGSPII